MTNTELYTDVDFVADALFGVKDSLIVNEPQWAMFYYFKPSGKYYSEGKGYVPAMNATWTREQVLFANYGKMPGLRTDASDLRIVIIPEIETVYGCPQILEPVEDES